VHCTLLPPSTKGIAARAAPARSAGLHRSCRSVNQAEFRAELLIHFGGLKNLDKPGVWLFPELLVCLECGFAQTTIPASELAQLAAENPTRTRAAGAGVGSIVPSVDQQPVD